MGTARHIVVDIPERGITVRATAVTLAEASPPEQAVG